MTVFILLTPANLNDFTCGGDAITNFLYVSVGVALFASAIDSPWQGWVPAAIFLGVALSSRATYGLILVPIAALAFQRASRVRAVTQLLVVLLTACAVTIPVFMPNILPRLLAQLQQNSNKLVYMPAYMHTNLSLPLIALLICFTGFFVRMSLARVFFIFGAAMLVIVAPVIVVTTIHLASLPRDVGYLQLGLLPICLWILSRYEETLPSNPNVKPSRFSPARSSEELPASR